MHFPTNGRRGWLQGWQTYCLLQPMNRHPDAKLIEKLGNPAELARTLSTPKRTVTPQTVQNWKYRGIPEIWRLRRPDVFGGKK